MRKELRSILINAIGPTGLCLFLSTSANAQLTVAPQTDLEAMTQALAGAGVQIENPTIVCHTQGYGEFTFAGNLLGATEGVLLTTGTIANAYGPNNVDNRSFQQNTTGDALLSIVNSRTTYDACRLEFDLIPSGDSIDFDFVFASEEYNEWVGSQYNDVFGFFISGPGIIGDPGIGNDKNIALLPGTNNPITINNVNNGINDQYFHDNTGGSQIQYDGFTRSLFAKAAVQPCATYHVKIVVADASDRMFDSGLFIQKVKSNGVTLSSSTANGIPELVEGCNSGNIRFSRSEASATPLILTYFLQGTAMNGVDYSAIGNVDPSVPKTVVIPAGATYVDVPVTPLPDGTLEGSEYLRVILGNPNCILSQSDSIDLYIEDILPASVMPGNTTICQGGTVQFMATGGTGYSWSPATGLSATNIANPLASPLATTTYTVEITNGACSRSFQRTITVVDMSLSAIVTRPLCNGQSNGAINLSITGGTPPYMFNWSGPNGYVAFTEDVVNIPSGTYTVTVTDANDCPRVQSFNVNTPAPLAASSTAPVLTYGQNIACHGGTTGSIALSITGGTAPYTVVWTGPNGYSSTIQNPVGLAAGTYNATITDVNGCTVTTARTLSQPPMLEPLIGNVQHVACRGGSNGSATATITGGMPPYSYSWNTVPVQTSATATGLSAGIRTVTITDGYGCQVSASVTITQPASVLSVTLQDVTDVVQCQGQNNPHGSGTAVASGGTAPYAYYWNTVPVQTTAYVEFSSGGTYSVVVTDANGCTTSQAVTVTQPGETALVVSQTTNVDCFGSSTGSATVAITGGSNVQSIVWNTNPPQYGTSLINVPAGTYNAIAQHANGCQSAVTVTLGGPTGGALGTPTISGSTAVACFGDNNGSITLDASGGTPPYSYSYNGSSVAGNTINGLSAGSHAITVIDANGCSSTGNVIVDGPTSALAVNITQFTNVLCSGAAQGTATALASGGTGPYSYEWDSAPVQTGPDATDLPPGTYTVTVTDANGCTAINTVTIGGPSTEMQGIIEDYAHVSCYGANDGFATVSVWGGSNSFTITWNTVPPQTGVTATGLGPGLYTVEVVDNNGCDTPKFLYVDIIGPDGPLDHSIALSNYNGSNTSCAGAADGWIDVTVFGGNSPYSYSWSDDFNNVAGMEDPSGLDAGTYYLHVIDAFGCTIQDTVTITEPTVLSLNVDLSTFPGGHNVSCAGATDGSADLTISGGTAPYNIAWSSGQGYSASTEDIAMLGAGIYDVLVTDANGCTATTSITLTAPEPIAVSALLSDHNGFNVSCADAIDGSINTFITGGIAPYTFIWSDGSIAEDLDLIGAGDHTIVVTDANGCIAEATFELIAPDPLLATTDATLLNGGFNTTCAGAADGSITSTVNGGVMPYTLAWNGPGGLTSSDPTISGLTAGTYTLTVTDANNCGTSSMAQITSPPQLGVDLNSTTYNGGYNIPCNGDSSASIAAAINGGIAPYVIAWTGPDGSTSDQPGITGLSAGTYHIAITDANGCTASDSITLTEPDPLGTLITTGDVGMGYQVSCAGNDGSISIDVTGGTSAYNFSWNGPGGYGSTSEDISGLASGTYDLEIMDANGCMLQQSVTLSEPDQITASFNTTANTCSYDTAGVIDATVNGGAGGYDLLWTGPDGFTSTSATLQDLATGIYTLNVSDPLGCTASFNVALNEPFPLQSGAYVSFYGMYNLQCEGDSSGVIELYPTGGTAPYEFSITGPDGFTSQSGMMAQLIAGSYSIGITDNMGCTLDTIITLTQPIQSINATFDVSIYPSGTNVSCYDGNDGWIEANVTGGIVPYEIFWRGPDSLEWNMADIYNLPAGDYSYELVVIDANQCSFTTDITLTQPDTSIYASSTTSQYGNYNITCAGMNDGSIDLTAAGGSGSLNFQWIGPGGFTSTAEDLPNVGAGSYIVSITDINGCITDHPVMIVEPPPMSIVFSSNSILCAGGNNGIIQMDLAGGTGVYSYTWSGPGVAPNADVEITDLFAGTYCVDAADDHGCAVQECITLTEPAAITADAAVTGADCGSTAGAVDLIVTGGISPYNFAWSNGATTEDLIGIAAGDLEVQITDDNGCITNTPVTIPGSTAVTTSAMITDATCAGASSGAIDLSITSGAAPFQIMWSNGSATEDLIGISSGDHTVSITDANGCSAQATYSVMESEGLVLDTTLSIYPNGYNISSYQGNDGSITIDASGGNTPYAFSWSTGSDAPHVDGLTAGTYAVEVTDINGCTASLVIVLTEPTDLEMPTGFSPNGDGSNDVFFIRGLDGYATNMFTVFNRWGNVVFDRPNYKNDWAGTNANGDQLPNGTYFVILTVNDGTRILQGYVDMRR